MKRVAPAIDKYHNAIGMRTLVKPIVKGPFKDCLGEIRAIYKNQLFVWFFKSPNPHLLRESNGFRAFKTYEVIHAGHEHLNSAQADIQARNEVFLTGKPDRRAPDKEVRGMTVYISRGDLKGYKGKVLKANETEATVEVFAKGNRIVTLSRDEICPIFDDTAPMRLEANAPIMISFDQAMNQDFVNVQ